MEKRKSTEVHIYEKDDLINSILDGVDEKLKDLKKTMTPKQPTQLLNRKETSLFFGVTTMTIDSWTRKSILRAYRTGNRKYYKREELEEALTKIEK